MASLEALGEPAKSDSLAPGMETPAAVGEKMSELRTQINRLLQNVGTADGVALKTGDEIDGGFIIIDGKEKPINGHQIRAIGSELSSEFEIVKETVGSQRVYVVKPRTIEAAAPVERSGGRSSRREERREKRRGRQTELRESNPRLQRVG